MPHPSIHPSMVTPRTPLNIPRIALPVPPSSHQPHQRSQDLLLPWGRTLKKAPTTWQGQPRVSSKPAAFSSSPRDPLPFLKKMPRLGQRGGMTPPPRCHAAPHR